MATVEQIYETMKQLAPPELAESWDNSGLLVDCGGTVTRVLTTLDITAEVVQEAAERGCELIVAHHPVIFEPLKRLEQGSAAFLLVKNGISAICMHTNLDAAPGGVNDTLAAFFGMQSPAPFAGGCGRVGNVERTTVPQLAQRCAEALHTRVKWVDAPRAVTRLAVVSGAGGSCLQDALDEGADCLITGEANHHVACDAREAGVGLIAAGHFATEWPVVPVLARQLWERWPELVVLCSKTNTDPFRYI